MAPKKQKAQKMALTDFFADTATGSWADDDFVPSAPAAKDPSLPKKGDPGYLDSMPDRGARSFAGGPPQREEVPLPTAPPFTAFVGNMTFETSESELLDFFQDLTPVTARLVKAEGKSKGFGYIEFGSQEKLKQALERTGAQLGGRSVRISVAEAPSSSSRKDFAPSAAEESSQWRRSGPLPARETAPPARRGTSFTSSPIGDAGSGGAERDWGAARGAKFTPSPQMSSPSEFRRDPSGPGRLREPREPREGREDLGPSQADEASAWRSSKPLVDVSKAAVGAVSSEQSSPGLADTESTWSRGSKLRTPVTDAPPRSGTTSPVEREWTRGKSFAESRQNSVEGEKSGPRLPPAPLERRKLNLAPRSANDTISTPASPSGRSSIFGGAQPIDSATKEAAAADKLKQQEGERRAAIAKAREEEERKVRLLAEERERSIKEALANAGVPSTPSGGAGGERGERGEGGRGGRGGGRGGYGGRPGQGQEGRRISHDRPPHQPHSQGSSQPHSRAHSGPARPREREQSGSTTQNTPKFDADGFEIAGSGRGGKGGAAAAAAAPATSSAGGAGGPAGQPRKEVKKGFSFSAAVAQGGFEETEEKDESSSSSQVNGGGENKDGGVEAVTNGVESVKV